MSTPASNLPKALVMETRCSHSRRSVTETVVGLGYAVHGTYYHVRRGLMGPGWGPGQSQARRIAIYYCEIWVAVASMIRGHLLPWVALGGDAYRMPNQASGVVALMRDSNHSRHTANLFVNWEQTRKAYK